MFGLKIISEKKYDDLRMNQAPELFYSCQIPNLFEIDGKVMQVGVILCAPDEKLAWLKAMSKDFSLDISFEELQQDETKGESFFRFIDPNMRYEDIGLSFSWVRK